MDPEKFAIFSTISFYNKRDKTPIMPPYPQTSDLSDLSDSDDEHIEAEILVLKNDSEGDITPKT